MCVSKKNQQTKVSLALILPSTAPLNNLAGPQLRPDREGCILAPCLSLAKSICVELPTTLNVAQAFSSLSTDQVTDHYPGDLLASARSLSSP